MNPLITGLWYDESTSPILTGILKIAPKNNNIIKASNIGVKAFPILSTNLLGCKLKNNDIAKKD